MVFSWLSQWCQALGVPSASSGLGSSNGIGGLILLLPPPQPSSEGPLTLPPAFILPGLGFVQSLTFYLQFPAMTSWAPEG